VTSAPPGPGASLHPEDTHASGDDLTGDPLLSAVLRLIRGENPRLRDLLSCLVRHLHAVVEETRLTEQEWALVVDFLVQVGHTCTATRNEFILLSDMLGASSAVIRANHEGPAAMTPSSVEGPFHSPAPRRALGDWISHGAERTRGEVVVVHGHVTDCDGVPVPGAEVDVWQSDDVGHYDVQDATMPAGNLRGLFTTDDHGAYWFRTIRPCSYPVPTDGPVGDLLTAIGRHPMRPAHIHLQVTAPGHRPLATHLFPAGEPYLDSDAAFAVEPGLIVDFRPETQPTAAARYGVDAPFLDVPFDLHLAAKGSSTEAGA
jgi:hydroxyquinol 1,2-dioxygenase